MIPCGLFIGSLLASPAGLICLILQLLPVTVFTSTTLLVHRLLLPQLRSSSGSLQPVVLSCLSPSAYLYPYHCGEMLAKPIPEVTFVFASRLGSTNPYRGQGAPYSTVVVGSMLVMEEGFPVE